jgi:arsenate reductase
VNPVAILYGIRTCDTVKRARRWLDDRGIAHRFHDFRADGLEAARLERWLRVLGWEQLVNRQSATWRRLDAGTRERVAAAAGELLLEYPTLIRRPVLEQGDSLQLGFSPDAYRQFFGSA